MHANFFGLTAVALTLLVFKLTYDHLRGRAVGVKAAWLGIGICISVPGILFGIYYLHVLPEWEWFYAFRSWPGTEFLAVFLGVAAGALAALLPRWLLILPLFAMVALAAIPYIKPVLGPLKDEAFRNRTQGESILQSTSATCGPASVCNALQQLGMHATEYEIARAAHTYVGGTEAWYLARAIRAKGLMPRFVFRNTFDPTVGQPAIVGVRLSGLGHFIAVLKVEGNFVTFVDPAWGSARVSLDEFFRRFDFTGFHLVVTKR
jgi:predicted double-glycine peptidase